MENNTQENLIVKKFNLLSAIKNVGKRSLIALMLASMLATTPACTPRDNDPNTNENGNENNNENQNNNGNQNGGSENGQTNKYSEYSQLLQGVLTNTEYNSLIANAEANPSLYKTARFNPHPYGFLEDEGYDISAIKNGTINCYSMSYILYEDEPNNLYISTRVENAGGYYTNYLITYHLTDDEVRDYKLAHSGGGTTFYIQSAFMNDAISRSKTPTKVVKADIMKEKFDKLTSSFMNLELTSTDGSDIVFTNYKDNTFDILVLPRYYQDDQLSFGDTLINLSCSVYNYDYESIYNGAANYGAFGVEATARTDYKANFFFVQEAYLEHGYCEDLTK